MEGFNGHENAVIQNETCDIFLNEVEFEDETMKENF
jgi:hypothetical protein